MRPRIGIPLPTSNDFEYNVRCWPEYAAAVERAGGEAIQISLGSESHRRSLATGCDGFVLPGSPADVDPRRYGHTPDPATAVADAAREMCDEAILEHAQATGTPILGICFGMQGLNVRQGGTLVQDLLPIPVNHAAGAQVGVAHAVLVAACSMLGGLLTASEAPVEGQFRRLPVNSSHHQAIAIPGEDFTVVARSAQDGVIEAIEARLGRAPVIGVQWHPERSVEGSAASRALFLWLVMAAADLRDSGGSSLADTL